LFNKFPRLRRETKELVASITRGARVLLLRLRILELLCSYTKITVRMLFYRLVSVYNYPNDRRFYKRLQYSLKRLRKFLPELNFKFEDPSRPLRKPRFPNPKLELWMEKASLEFFLRKLADKYRVPTLAERGFGSITMFRKAVERARRRGVEKVLFISDHDPSGLKIDEVTRREMLPIKVERIILTMDQIKKYRLPPIKVKRTDSRAKKYMEKFGDRAWETEALPPRALLHIVEQKLRENIPKEFLEELRLREEAEKIARRLEKRLIGEILHLLKEGLSEEKILTQLASKYGLRLRRRRTESAARAT